MVMSFEEFLRSRGALSLPFGGVGPGPSAPVHNFSGVGPLPPGPPQNYAGIGPLPPVSNFAGVGPLPPTAQNRVPQQSVGERNRFLEQNLPPGQETFSGQQALAQALMPPPTVGNIGTNPLNVGVAQALPGALADWKTQAAQQDIARIGQRPTAPQITSFMEITPDLLPYLSPKMQAFVLDYQDQFRKAQAEDPTFQEIPNEFYLDSANRDIQRRVGMTAEELSADNAALAEQEGTFKNIVFSPLETIGNAMDAGRKWSVGQAGDNAYLYVNGKDMDAGGKLLSWLESQNLPGTDIEVHGDFYDWMRDPKNAPLIKNAYENGYTAENGATFTGGNAVWELFANGQDRWHRTFYDLAYDPLTYAAAVPKPLEAAAAGVKAFEPASAGGRLLAKALETAAAGANLPDVVLNQVADKALELPLSKAGEVLKDVPILGHLSRQTASSSVQTAAARNTDAWLDAARQQSVPENVAPTTDAFLPGPIQPPDPLIGPQPLPNTGPTLDPSRMLPPPTLGPPAPIVPDPIALPGPGGLPGPGAGQLGVPVTQEDLDRIARQGAITDPNRMLPSPVQGPPAPPVPDPIALPGPKLGTALTPQELETLAPTADLPDPALAEPVTPQTPEIPVSTRKGYTYVGERGDYRIVELKDDRVRIDKRADNGDYPKRNQVIVPGKLDDGIARAKRVLTGEAQTVGTATPDLPAQSLLPDPAVPDPVTAPAAKPTVDLEELAAQEELDSMIRQGQQTQAEPLLPEPVATQTSDVLQPNAVSEAPTPKATRLEPTEPPLTGAAEEPGTPTPQGRTTPKVGWSVTPNPNAKGIKDVLPEDQWSRIRARIEDWATTVYEPYMASKATKENKVIAEAGYRKRIIEAAIEEGIDPNTLPEFKGSSDWTAIDKRRTNPAKLYRVIHDVPPLNPEEQALLDEAKAVNPKIRTPEETALIGELDPTVKDRQALYQAGVLRKEPPTAAKGTPEFVKESQAYDRYNKVQAVWRVLNPGKAAPGEGPVDAIGDLARWFFLDESPMTGESRAALTQPDPFPNVSGDVRNVLNETFEDAHPEFGGMRVGEVGQALTPEARADQEEIRSLVAGGHQSVTPERGVPKGGKITTTKKVTRYLKDGSKITVTVPTERTAANPGQRIAELRRKWAGFGDIERDDITQLVANRLGHERKVAINPRATRQLPLLVDIFLDATNALLYRLPRNELLANPVLSWAYTMRNMISNQTSAALLLKGQGMSALKSINVRDMYRGFKDIETSAAARMEDGLGVSGGMPSELVSRDIKHSGERATNLDVVSIGQDTRMRQLSRALRITEPVAKAYDWKRWIDHRIEVAMKMGGAYAPMLRAFVAEEIKPLAEHLALTARNRGLPFTEEMIERDLFNLRNADGVFSPHDVHDLLHRRATEAGATEAAARVYAKTGSERWLGAARNARQKAIDQTNRAFPGRKMTNADKYLSYVFLFHMWPTRAGKFVLEEMIRDPRIIMWWQRAHEGLDKMAEDEHYPESARGLIKLAMSPLGMQLYANPQALFMLNQLKPQGVEYDDPEGETQIGHGLKWLEEKSGLSPTPFFDALFNVVGVYGEDFLPDPFPSPTRQAVGAMIDGVMAYTGNGFGTPIYQQEMGKIRAKLSGIVPGTSNVPYVDPADKRNDPVASAVLLQDPDLAARMTSPDPKVRADAETELSGIMDPEGNDPRRIEAEKTVAGIGLITFMMSRAFPLGIRSKNPLREEMIEKNRATRDVPYDQMTPQQKADHEARGFVTTMPEAMGPKAQQDQYGALGTERQQALDKGWNTIAYSTLAELGVGFLVVDGKQYTTRELAAMDPEIRKSLADHWVSEQNGTDELAAHNETQKTFKDANVDYAAYSDWAKQSNDYPGGFEQWVKDQSAISPKGYGLYIKQLSKKIRDDPIAFEQRATSLDAYLASEGQKSSIYGANLESNGNSALARTIASMVGGKGGGSSKSYSDTPEGRLASLKDKLSEYDVKMQIYNDAVKSVTGGVMIGNGPNDLSGPFAQPIIDQLKARGIEPPSKPEIVRVYLDWSAAQPEGSDTSPEAFSVWFEKYKTGTSGTTAANTTTSALTSATTPTTPTASGRYYPETYIPDVRMGGLLPAR